MRNRMQMVVFEVTNGYIVRPAYQPGEEMNFGDWFVFRDSSEFNFWLQEIEQETKPMPEQFSQ